MLKHGQHRAQEPGVERLQDLRLRTAVVKMSVCMSLWTACRPTATHKLVQRPWSINLALSPSLQQCVSLTVTVNDRITERSETRGQRVPHALERTSSSMLRRTLRAQPRPISHDGSCPVANWRKRATSSCRSAPSRRRSARSSCRAWTRQHGFDPACAAPAGKGRQHAQHHRHRLAQHAAVKD